MRKSVLAVPALLYAGVAFCLAATMLHTLPAFAGDTTVTIPWGDWTVKAIDYLLPAALTAIASVLTYVSGKYLPPMLRDMADERTQRQINELLEKAVLSAVAQTKGAISGKTLQIEVANAVLAAAANYAVDQAPKLIEKVSGDDALNLYKMILARMEDFGLVRADFEVPHSLRVEEVEPVA